LSQEDEGRFASIDVGTTDFSSVLTDLSVIEFLKRKYRANFRMPRLLFATLPVTPAGVSSFSDADALATASLYNVGARDYVFNGTTWERYRGGGLLAKSVDATAAGSSAVWTPASGKKFRLLAFEVNIGDDATIGVAGVETIRLLDSATRIWGVQTQLGTTALTTDVTEQHIVTLPPNGYLSAAANNVLNVSLGTVLATGVVSVNAWGLEE